MATARPRVLFVDDEPQLLEAIAMNLRKGFEVLTATSAAAGLEQLEHDADISVVVSDMRMPQMSGAVFLTHARRVAPHAVRMLLTGQTDLASAVSAVNQGQIFRFLTKPCARDELQAAMEKAVEQHRLEQAERELLEQTLRGSIQMLVDILALTNPAAFGRANRIRARVKELAQELAVTEMWPLEIAALASQLGYITLPHDVCDKLANGRSLTDAEQALVSRTPEVAAQLLANIPRLEPVQKILVQHGAPPKRHADATGTARLVALGAHALRLALDIDALELGGTRDPLPPTNDAYDPEVVAAYLAVRARRLASQRIQELPVTALRVGMVFADDVRLANGTLLVARGYEVTHHFIERVRNFPPGTIRGAVRVH
jgi:FixJ family two-component response regulator